MEEYTDALTDGFALLEKAIEEDNNLSRLYQWLIPRGSVLAISGQKGMGMSHCSLPFFPNHDEIKKQRDLDRQCLMEAFEKNRRERLPILMFMDEIQEYNRREKKKPNPPTRSGKGIKGGSASTNNENKILRKLNRKR